MSTVKVLFYMLLYVAYIKLTTCEGELKSVVVIYRHGDRTPTSLYPNDPYRNMSYWPEGFGQLTNRGKMQHYKHGQWFRNRYNGFLSEMYSRDEIYVRSTDVDRTLMSAESNLAGLYPPKSYQVWNENIQWQPIPIHTVPESEDPYLAMKKKCPRYDFLLEELNSSPYFQDINQHNQALYQYLQTHSGMEVTRIEDVKHLYSTLLIEGYFNLSLPEWTHSVYPGRMRPWAYMTFALPCFTPELARLKAGVFFGELVKYFRNRISSPENTHKFIMYSAHDNTIANLLNAMGAFDWHIPPYTSTIIFEHRVDSENNNYLNIFYKNSTEPQKLNIRGCGFDCLIDDFERVLEPITLTIEQWTEECLLEIKPQLQKPFEEDITSFWRSMYAGKAGKERLKSST